jgi:nucleotide-binding universal stress UspA family protein
MKILLATDGSEYSEAAVQELIRRSWPTGSEVRVVSVAQPVPAPADPAILIDPFHVKAAEEERKKASREVNRVSAEISKHQHGLKVSTQVLEGPPKKMIVEEAERWGADLVVLGSHGHGPVARFLLGSVAQAVALHAPCSVEIVRQPNPKS